MTDTTGKPGNDKTLCRHRRWFQFGLRTLFLAVTILSVGLSYEAMRPVHVRCCFQVIGPTPQAKTVQFGVSGVSFKSLGTAAGNEQFRSRQLDTLRSRAVLDAAVKKLGNFRWPSDDPVAWLRESIRVEYRDEDGTMTVGIDSRNPERVAPIVDAIVEAYSEAIQREEAEADQELQESWNRVCGPMRDAVIEKTQLFRLMLSRVPADDLELRCLVAELKLLSDREHKLIESNAVELHGPRPYVRLLGREPVQPKFHWLKFW